MWRYVFMHIMNRNVIVATTDFLRHLSLHNVKKALRSAKLKRSRYATLASCIPLKIMGSRSKMGLYNKQSLSCNDLSDQNLS